MFFWPSSRPTSASMYIKHNSHRLIVCLQYVSPSKHIQNGHRHLKVVLTVWISLKRTETRTPVWQRPTPSIGFPARQADREPVTRGKWLDPCNLQYLHPALWRARSASIDRPDIHPSSLFVFLYLPAKTAVPRRLFRAYRDFLVVI